MNPADTNILALIIRVLVAAIGVTIAGAFAGAYLALVIEKGFAGWTARRSPRPPAEPYQLVSWFPTGPGVTVWPSPEWVESRRRPRTVELL